MDILLIIGLGIVAISVIIALTVRFMKQAMRQQDEAVRNQQEAIQDQKDGLERLKRSMELQERSMELQEKSMALQESTVHGIQEVAQLQKETNKLLREFLAEQKGRSPSDT